MAKTIKVLSGGTFPEKQVNSDTFGALRTELLIRSRASISDNGTGVQDE